MCARACRALGIIIVRYTAFLHSHSTGKAVRWCSWQQSCQSGGARCCHTTHLVIECPARYSHLLAAAGRASLRGAKSAAGKESPPRRRLQQASLRSFSPNSGLIVQVHRVFGATLSLMQHFAAQRDCGSSAFLCGSAHLHRQQRSELQ